MQWRIARLRWATAGICLAAGLMISVSAVNSQTGDLRPARNTQLIDVVRDRAAQNAATARRVTDLRREVDALAVGEQDSAEAVAMQAAAEEAGLTAVRGPGITVVLSDAPSSVTVPGIDPDLLVVHQQDIQAIVNVLWASGAEAMTIQGQRVTSTTGIKCVGNTVVLHGTPYAPPYTITAIGDPVRLERGLNESAVVRIYRQYVEAYHLGYSQQVIDDVSLPAYTGPIGLRHAKR